MLRKVLFPTLFEPLALPCVELLYPLRAAGLEEIVLLFVIDRDEVGYVPFGGFDRAEAEDLADRAKLRFADWAESIEKEGFRCTRLVETGRPAAKILEIAAREQVDFIVTGRQRSVSADVAHLGGTAMEVLRRSPVPVMVLRKCDEVCFVSGGGDGAIRLLFATDLTSDSDPALEVVKRLAGAVSRVDVAHVIGKADLERLDESQLHAEEKVRKSRIESVCAELRALGKAADGHLRAGEVAEELLGAASDLQSALVVMGTTEKDWLHELFQGSPSHRVAELSPVPVILVPSRPGE